MPDLVKNPVEVFDSLKPLPSTQVTELWPAEKEVLEKYYALFANSERLAIQLPTGSGKSLIGILIAEAWRRKGKRVAILTSTIALSDDMNKKCQDLGIEGVVITGRRDSLEENRQRLRNIKKYKRTQSIGIFNYWSYMYAQDIAEPDILIIDDADGFENLLVGHYSIVIPREEEGEIWDSVVTRLASYRVYQKLESFLVGRLPDDYQLIYFPHSIEMSEVIRKRLLARDRSSVSQELLTKFDQNKDRMHSYLMFVSNDAIILAPQIYPASMHARLRNIRQTIFMSATIGTPEMLHKRLGFPKKIEMISEGDLSSSVGTMGRRIIFPISGLSPSASVTGPVLEAIRRIVFEFQKVLVLCVSFADASRVRDSLQSEGWAVISYKTEADIEAFRKLDKGVLLAAGRFFGLDLSGKACRVVVIPRLPYVLGPTDLLLREILEDLEYVNEKVSHRIVQGCGRCNRNPSDRAIYLILDGRLASDILGDSRIFGHFPDRMRAEADYGQEFTDIGGLDGAISQGRLLLDDKLPDFAREIDDRMVQESDIPTKPSKRPFLEEIQAWHDLCERRNYVDAAQGFENAAEKCTEDLDKYRSWLHYLAAFSFHLAVSYHQEKSYQPRVIKNLEIAMKSGYTSWFSGLKVIVNELSQSPPDDRLVITVENQAFKERVIRAWQEFFATNQSRKQTPYVVWERLCETLLKGTHNAICDALETMLELVGFEVHSQRRETGKPDILAFSTSGDKYVCIVEVKSAGQGTELTRDEVDQVTGHRAGYQSQYPDYQIYPLVFTNKQGQSQTALEKAAHNARILRAPIFVAFLRLYLERMEQAPKAWEPSIRLKLLERIPTLDRFMSLFKSQEQPLVEPAELKDVFG